MSAIIFFSCCSIRCRSLSRSRTALSSALLFFRSISSGVILRPNSHSILIKYLYALWSWSSNILMSWKMKHLLNMYHILWSSFLIVFLRIIQRLYNSQVNSFKIENNCNLLYFYHLNNAETADWVNLGTSEEYSLQTNVTEVFITRFVIIWVGWRGEWVILHTALTYILLSFQANPHHHQHSSYT